MDALNLTDAMVLTIRVLLEFVGAFALILAFWIIGGGIIEAHVDRYRARRGETPE